MKQYRLDYVYSGYSELRNISNPLGGLKLPLPRRRRRGCSPSKHLKSAWRIETVGDGVDFITRELRNISNPLGGLKPHTWGIAVRIMSTSKHLKSAWRIETSSTSTAQPHQTLRNISNPLGGLKHHELPCAIGNCDLRNISNPLGGLKRFVLFRRQTTYGPSKHLKSAWRIETYDRAKLLYSPGPSKHLKSAWRIETQPIHWDTQRLAFETSQIRLAD